MDLNTKQISAWLDGFHSIINTMGIYIPICIFVFIAVVLRTNPILFRMFVIGGALNSLLNLVIKGLTQQPRPSSSKSVFPYQVMKWREKPFWDILANNLFGLPSGHAQTSAYSITFFYLAFKSNLVYANTDESTVWFRGFMLLVLFGITLYQRIASKEHSLFQVIVGSLLGVAVAHWMFQLAQTLIKGNKQKRKEEGNKVRPFGAIV